MRDEGELVICRKLGIFLLFNILALAVHFLPWGILDIQYESYHTGGLKFYYYDADREAHYLEEDSHSEVIEPTYIPVDMQVFMRASARNHLRIDFEGLSGTVKIDSLQFYRLFTVETMDSDQVMHFFSQKQGVEQDDEGRYVYQQKGAQIIGGQFQGKRTVNPYAVFAEVLFVLILMGYGNPRVKRMIIDADRGLYSCYGILAEEAKAIVSFYSGWYCLWIFVTGLLVLGYGFKVFSYSVSIDTEIGMFLANYDGWIRDGRFGIVILKKLFLLKPLVPFAANFLSVVFLGIAALLWNAVIFMPRCSLPMERPSQKRMLLFIGMYVSYPSLAEMMNFSTFNLEVALGMAFSGIAVLLFHRWFMEKSRQAMVMSLGFFVLSVAIYQSMVILFFVGLLCVLYGRIGAAESDGQVVDGFAFVRYMSLFLPLGIAVYYVINKLANIGIQQYHYLDGFIRWGKDPYVVILTQLGRYFSGIFSGRLIYGGEFLAAVYLFFVIRIVWLIWKKPDVWEWKAVLLFGIASGPFLMSLVFAGGIPIRSQVVLPLIAAFGAAEILKCTGQQGLHSIRFVCTLALFLVCFHQTYILSFLFQGEYVKTQNDISTVHSLGQQIEALEMESIRQQKGELPVVYIGRKSVRLSANVAHKGEVMGYSFLEWGENRRIPVFMRIFGYNFPLPVYNDAYGQALENGETMPSWPETGSIAVRNGIIVVKLSDDRTQ